METMLLAQYMSQCEGPLWNSVRGKGLAYDASIYVMPDMKSLALNQKVVEETILSKKLDETQFEAAKRSLVYCLLNTIRGLNQPITLKICSQIWHADMNDVLEKASTPLLSLFDEAKTVRSVVVNPSKVNDLMKTFPGTELVKLEDLQLHTSK
uniref:Uncharacterized protein n=1 Tax=Ditylenchus dipsaci TaxID=166011 RepID=A0A915ED26_9BILA